MLVESIRLVKLLTAFKLIIMFLIELKCVCRSVRVWDILQKSGLDQIFFTHQRVWFLVFGVDNNVKINRKWFELRVKYEHEHEHSRYIYIYFKFWENFVVYFTLFFTLNSFFFLFFRNSSRTKWIEAILQIAKLNNETYYYKCEVFQ